MNSQGDVALIIERDDQTGQCMIIGETKPQDGLAFQEKELRDVYMEQAIPERSLEDEDREKLYKYFCQTSHVKDREKYSLQPRGVFGQVVEWEPEGTVDPQPETVSVLATKKYKKVADKVRPVYQDLPEKFRIVRNITGDPLANMPKLSPRPPEFTPTGRYTQERKEAFDKVHEGDFLWPEERKLVHQLVMQQNKGFAWDDSEKGRFRSDFFPPVEIPVVEHVPWVLKNIPIPPGMHQRVCEFIKTKIDAGTYEPSSSSYRSRWFTVLKKDQVSFRIVHSLEPLNAVTIAHSGLPPVMETLAEHIAGRACGAILDLYVGYDERLLAESSRDLTTFQTPYGALRLVTLPMGWTNSVPIFHEDVTYILREEIPEYTEPYIDDVPVRGPATRYELEGGGYETIPENSGIRRFVWEHLNNVNRIVQRVKYSGGTFSGYKSTLCAADIMVVGHLCGYEGRKPMPDKVHVILNWGDCKTVSDVRSFMGTVGLLRIYIEDYATKAEHIQKLMRSSVTFEWGDKQRESMELLKQGVRDAKCIIPLDYSAPGAIVLAVDTSWRAIGFYIYQEDPADKKKKRYARFGSILLNEREARFSQPKRELFGLLRALEACMYWLLGCRKLVVETDAKYLKGMLDNPGMGPNATINRWIDKILMFHFELRHVPGKTFGPDGLSRREGQPGDEVFSNTEEFEDGPVGPPEFSKLNEEDEDPWVLDRFKDTIDTRGGYQQQLQPQMKDNEHLATSVKSFAKECRKARSEYELEKQVVRRLMAAKQVPEEQEKFLEQYMLRPSPPLYDFEEEGDPEAYDESNRTPAGQSTDERLPLVKLWLKDPTKGIVGMSGREYHNFTRFARHFFIDGKERLYRRAIDDTHKLVIAKEDRTRMMRLAHDNLGHRGSYATRMLLSERFWWPELERDVHWHVKTCHLCQERQKTMIQIPRTETHTPSIFQELHIDTMHMSPESYGYKYIVHGRCALTSWAEGRALRKENGETISAWLFEDIICRWGCLREIVTDNGGPFGRALEHLKAKWGIDWITISSYNSKANGKVERPHWDIRQMLYKACGGEHKAKNWFKYFHYVLWADRVSIRKGLGCSPFFMVTGAHPVLPMDIVEATWLVELPDEILSSEDLIAYRAIALAKHKVHIDDMRKRISKAKRDLIRKFEEKSAYKIKNYTFKKGDLVLMRNSPVEMSLNRKMKRRWEGPYIVIARKSGGAYILADMSGKVFKDKVAAFRVIPYFARRAIKSPETLDAALDQSPENIRKLMEKSDDEGEDHIEKEIYDEEPLRSDAEEDEDDAEAWWEDTLWP
jgi:hypothetical protein